MTITPVLAIFAAVCLSSAASIVSTKLGRIKGFLETLLSSGFLRQGGTQDLIDERILTTQDMLKATTAAIRGVTFILVSSILLIVSLVIK